MLQWIKRNPIKVVVGLVVIAALAIFAAASASSDNWNIRDSNGKPITPGTEVAQLVKGPDGQCRPAPGQETGISGKAKPGESGSVTLSIDQETCKVIVSKVNETQATDPPTQRDEKSGSR